MQAPSVMMIEMAIDTFFKHPENMPEWLLDAQRKELKTLGPTRAKNIGASLTDDFRIGYELGLATARIMLMGNVELIKAGIKPDTLL